MVSDIEREKAETARKAKHDRVSPTNGLPRPMESTPLPAASTNETAMRVILIAIIVRACCLVATPGSPSSYSVLVIQDVDKRHSPRSGQNRQIRIAGAC